MKVVHLQNVNFFRDKKPILRDIDWQVQKGEHWAVLGQNGSGKTTLLRIVSGYLWPSEGKVEVLSKKFGEVDLRELRREIGWVSSDLQQQMQQNFSAKDIVISGHYASIGLYEKPKTAIVEKAKQLMDFIDCKDVADRLFPLLSFGEQKRVLIARALMHDPALLILDEPCAGLDLKARESFLQFVEKLGKKPGGPTLILVTHHIEEIVQSINQVICLRDGKIFAIGKKNEIINSETMSKVLEVDLEIKKHNNRFVSYIN